MRKYLTRAALSALALALAAPVAAQDAAPAAAAPAEAKPALWKVSDADTTIWLFGTVHALPAGITWYKGPVADAFKGSQALVTEIPETDPATLQGIVVSTAVLPAGQSLRAQLAKDDRAKLEKALVGYGFPADAFDRFEPWYAAVTLSMLPLLKSGFAASEGVETRLQAEAAAAKVPHTGLETPAYQLGLFDSLPREVQVKYLREVLDKSDEMPAQLRKMVAEWSAGRPEELAKLVTEGTDDPKLVAVLLTDRNKAWAQWIKTRLDQPGTVFVAVGAGHLAGKGSVQDQLSSQGLTAARVQ